jgi:hypothetical protein
MKISFAPLCVAAVLALSLSACGSGGGGGHSGNSGNAAGNYSSFTPEFNNYNGTDYKAPTLTLNSKASAFSRSILEASDDFTTNDIPSKFSKNSISVGGYTVSTGDDSPIYSWSDPSSSIENAMITLGTADDGGPDYGTTLLAQGMMPMTDAVMKSIFGQSPSEIPKNDFYQEQYTVILKDNSLFATYLKTLSNDAGFDCGDITDIIAALNAEENGGADESSIPDSIICTHDDFNGLNDLFVQFEFEHANAQDTGATITWSADFDRNSD